MTWDFERYLEAPEEDERAPRHRRPAPGKVSLTASLRSDRRNAPNAATGPRDDVDAVATSVQRKVETGHQDDPFGWDSWARPTRANQDVQSAAARGVSSPGGRLPFADEIQGSFGHHDISDVQAHVGGAAAEASAAIGARAYATGNHVAFAGAPDLHVAAHEAAHVVQQRGGVQLKGGVGEAGDLYERHADAVADKVVAGQSAEALLDELAPRGRTSVAGAAVQRVGMGDVRASEAGVDRPDTGGADHGPAAGFLRQLTAGRLVQSPRPLRLERGRPSTVTLLPMSDEPLPPDAPPLPVYCKLKREGTSVAEAQGQWLPMLVVGPALTLEIPGFAEYKVELHVNAGRPGARVLTSRLKVELADEDTVAGDEGERLVARSHNGDGAAPSVATYRDMLAAVRAAQDLTQRGDDASYARAQAMLAPVLDRLRAIHPALLERARDYGFSDPHMQQRFDGAITELRAWSRRLTMGSTIATDGSVARFQAAETEIKLATGESSDAPELRSLDRTVPIATAVGLAGMPVAAAAGAGLALGGAEIAGAVTGAGSIGGSILSWAGANPESALFLAEFLGGIALSISDNGVDGHFQQIETPEDAGWAVLQTVADAMMARQPKPGGVGVEIDPAPGPTPRPPGSSGQRGGGKPPPSSRGGQRSGDHGDQGHAPSPKRTPAGGAPDADTVKSVASAAGMKPQHVNALIRTAKKQQRTIMVRASNPASLQYLGKKGYRPKPPVVKTLNTATDGPHAGLIVKPAKPNDAQKAEIKQLESQGWSFDGDGVLRDPQGRAIHGDYDLQGVYQHGPDGPPKRVDTNGERALESLNKDVHPTRDRDERVFQHGANDDFRKDDPAPTHMGRQPKANETYLIAEPSGETRIVNGTAALQDYYDDLGIDWPYDDFRNR